jgi:hypothetical protein
LEWRSVERTSLPKIPVRLYLVVPFFVSFQRG